MPTHLAIFGARAIDGDTIDAVLVLPLGVSVQRSIRLKGFFAPEHHGANPDAAHTAQRRLQNTLDLNACHILMRGSKHDRYGRLVATLIVDGQAAIPTGIIGDCQLTEEAHRADLEVAKRNNRKRGASL